MKKVFLLLVLALLLVPTIFGLENTIDGVIGNATVLTFTLVSTTQQTVNPGIGDNVSYVTIFNVTSGAGGLFNLTNFTFHLPDNSSTQVVTDFKLENNDSLFVSNASTFTAAARNNYVRFDTTGVKLNNSRNGTYIYINWSLNQPIASSKIGVVLAGREYTETWNITSIASNVTVVNASLNVTPTYWHTRIGNPTGYSFNGTTKGYSATLTDILVWTDLNLSQGAGGIGNLMPFGSGWSTLSVAYNGPTQDASSGRSATAGEVTPVISPETMKKAGFWMIVGLGLLVLGGIIYGLVYLQKRPKF